jgi:Ca-activated chloride channel family protein
MNKKLRLFILIILATFQIANIYAVFFENAQQIDKKQKFEVRIVSPQPDSLPRGTIEIIAEVTTPFTTRVDRVEFYIDDQLVFVDNEEPYQYTWEPQAVLDFRTIRVLAFDKEGHFSRDTITLSKPKTSFRVQTDLVAVHATVTDSEGDFVRDLTKEDFVILEDGIPQNITNFSRENTPLSFILLMDVSSSMIFERIERAQESALQLAQRLAKGENKAMIMAFDDKIYLLQDFTNDQEALAEAIALLAADGGTALYDAIAQTVRKLRNIRMKKAIIVLSDGDDTDSDLDFDSVLDYCKQSDTLIYSVGLQRLTFSQTFKQETDLTLLQLRRVAEITGGKAYFPDFIDRLNRIYYNIGRELESQYSLGYISTNRLKDGSWRKILVRIKNRPDLTVRARQGYYAPTN